MSKKTWQKEDIQHLFEMPLLELIYQAQTVHRQHFSPHEIELCTLLNIKTGVCPENCAYCPQSGHYDTGLQKEKLWNIEDVLVKAKEAKANGATRFCMGAAWRSPPDKDFPAVIAMVKAVNALGLESCLTIGMLNAEQAAQLKAAQLNYYNHNLDTSPEFYSNIINTHTYEDRLNTLAHISNTDIKVCCGGILGMGETQDDRIAFLLQLANLPKPPDSIPLNRLIPIKGTPLEKQVEIESFDFIRMVAVTRIVIPHAMIRLSAGRYDMSEEMQALCFMAGANSIHFGEKLLVTPNANANKDMAMLNKFGLKPKTTTTELTTHVDASH
jgi:biotin synthase